MNTENKIKLIEELKQYGKSLSKDEARRELQQAGIIDENGNLTPPYQ